MDRQLLERLDYLNYDEIPDWYRDNAYILTKYRDTNKGFKYYFYSVFKLKLINYGNITLEVTKIERNYSGACNYLYNFIFSEYYKSHILFYSF